MQDDNVFIKKEDSFSNDFIEMEEKGFFYSYNMIFDSLELDLSVYAVVVYLYLCRLADNKCKCFPSYETMAQHCRCSRNTAIKALKELMLCGLIIKKRRANGNEQTSNIYMIFSNPRPDLVQKNKKQLEREQDEYKLRLQNQSKSSASDALGSVRDALLEDSAQHELGSTLYALGGAIHGLEVLPIKGQPIYNNSSSIFNDKILQQLDTYILELIKKCYLDIFKTKTQTLKINSEAVPINLIREKYKELTPEHILQVYEYIKNQNIHSLSAIKTALYNSPEYVKLKKIENSNIYTIKKKNSFLDHVEHGYKKSFYDDLEKEIYKKSTR